MLPIALPFTIAEIAYRQEHIGAEYAQANAGRALKARGGRFGRHSSGAYRLLRASAPAGG